MHVKYKIKTKLDGIILNKKVGIAVCVLAPIIFFVSAYYLSNCIYGCGFNEIARDISFSIPFIKKGEVAGEADDVGMIENIEEDSTFEENLEPIYGDPKRITDENSNIDVSLVEVSVDELGTLQAPKNWNEGGWYRYGSSPGEPGNLIINAHYDNNYGGPAAFWKLKNLKTDDKVNVFDTYDRKYTYKVTNSFLVDINDPNRLEIFKEDQNATMTLITCGGVWVPGKSTYNKRLVVKAELVSDFYETAGESLTNESSSEETAHSN